MTTIGLIADTHGYWDDAFARHFAKCEAIWHLGDIGDMAIVEKLSTVAPTIAVRGNIDSLIEFGQLPEHHVAKCEGLTFLLTHIAGPPGKFIPTVQRLISAHEAQAVVCGHSHICKVQHLHYKSRDLWYINPGAAGRHGFHIMRTLLKMTVHEGQITSMQVIELGKRGTS